MYRIKNFKSKYRNKKTLSQGFVYDSKLEAKVGFDLEMQKRAGEIKDFERQVRVPLYVNGYKITTYIVDFKVYRNDDTIEWIEVKGMPTDTWKIKRNLFEALNIHDNPNEEYTIITKRGFNA